MPYTHELAARAGFKSTHELEMAGHLKSLGRPANNSDRYYSAQQIEDLRTDADWLAKATDAMRRHWRQRNADKPPAAAEDEAG